jgi:hypothetical protein
MALSDVFSELAAARAANVISRYAVGGAVAAAVYLEPAATEDVDIFIALGPRPGHSLVSLGPVYSFFKERGASVDGERLAIGDWLVQLLPPPTPLVEDALANAVSHDVEGVTVPIFSAAHLAAIALETGRLKDKLRLQLFLASPELDQSAFLALVERFGLQAKWSKAQDFLRENP